MKDAQHLRTPHPITPIEEISLDPSNWDAFAQVAHRALDEAIEHMRSIAERPPWRPLPPEARAEIAQPVPRAPTELAEVFERFRRAVLPYPTGNGHPRFWGWVMGNGTPDAVVADMLASAMNPHLAGYDQSASAVERQVIAWLIELMGFPASSSGLLVSGGTVANLTGLVVARHAMAGFDVRRFGVAGENRPRMRVYGSEETHSWAEKCCDVIGLGRQGFRRVACDRHGRIDIAALQRAIRADRDRGERAICVVANAGTVDIGAIDNLEALADVCAAESLWLHVDGAFGALAVLNPQIRPRLRGLDRADSLAFDMHKWGYLPYEVGCTLVRDGATHRAAFETQASYLTSPGRGVQPAALDLADIGIQLSRGFRALKVWMSLQTHGIDRIGRVIEQNVAQAGYLAQLIEAEPNLELLAPVPLNIVCFRYVVPFADEPALNALNREILLRVQETGVAVPSSTVRHGRFALRVAITNHRSRRDDFAVFIREVLALGKQLSAQADTATP